MTVSFYDPWKLAEHAKLVEAVLDAGFHCDAAGACFDLDKWRARAPRAGWNVCHATDREFGVESSTVCVLDGDFFVDGLPFDAGPKARRFPLQATREERCLRGR